MHTAMPLAGASQACPHLPQFCASVAKCEQAAPHRSKPSLHLSPHWLAAQVAVPFSGTGHAMPQPLQLSGLVVTSMQAPLQFARPPLQSVAHLPESHTSTAAQAVLQPPQRAGSLETSTQTPPQSWKPAAHLTPQAPF